MLIKHQNRKETLIESVWQRDFLQEEETLKTLLLSYCLIIFSTATKKKKRKSTTRTPILIFPS